MDCKDWVKARQNSGKGADCKEKVKQKKSVGKDENCKIYVKRQRSFDKEDFYENKVKRQQNSGKAELCEDGVKRQQVAADGIRREATAEAGDNLRTPDGQPARQSERMRAAHIRQVVPEGKTTTADGNRRQKNGRERRPSGQPSGGGRK